MSDNYRTNIWDLDDNRCRRTRKLAKRQWLYLVQLPGDKLHHVFIYMTVLYSEKLSSDSFYDLNTPLIWKIDTWFWRFHRESKIKIVTRFLTPMMCLMKAVVRIVRWSWDGFEFHAGRKKGNKTEKGEKDRGERYHINVNRSYYQSSTIHFNIIDCFINYLRSWKNAKKLRLIKYFLIKSSDYLKLH